MAKKALRCSKCSRSFALPAHLARHLSTIHKTSVGRPRSRKAGTSAAKAAGKYRKKRGPKAGRRIARGSSVTQWSSGVVSRMVGDMQSYLGELSNRRAALDAEAAAITDALKAMGAAVETPGAKQSARRRGRPPGSGMRAGSLKSYIVRVLNQRSTPMSPNEIARAVVKSGYKSKAKDLAKAVSNHLPDVKNLKKVGFGKYTL